MDFNIILKADESVVVIRVPRRLTSDTSGELKNILKNQTENNHYLFVIDLKETDYIDSAGLGAIVSKISVSRSNNGDVRLASPKESVMNLLELTHVKQIIKIFDSVDEAVSSFGE